MLDYIKHSVNWLFGLVSSDTAEDKTEEKFKPWSEDEIESLKKLVVSGLSYGEIAMILNRTESAIYQKYRRLNKGK